MIGSQAETQQQMFKTVSAFDVTMSDKDEVSDNHNPTSAVQQDIIAANQEWFHIA